MEMEQYFVKRKKRIRMKIKKEIILIVVVIVGIFVLEYVTSRISNNSVSYIYGKIEDITKEIEDKLENDETGEELKNKINEDLGNLKDEWFKKENKLSIYIEHDELEKVSHSIIRMEENSKNEEYNNALENGAEAIYYLNHFKEKNKFVLKNVF